jgi:osmotically-inducible protein OsmY
MQMRQNYSPFYTKSDAQLYVDIMDTLHFQPDLDESSITIKVKDGMVMLGGSVRYYPEKLIAYDAVRNIAGVQAVVEDIAVYLPGFAERSDNDIASEAMNVLAWTVQVPETALQLEVQNGRVTLNGTVEWWYQKEAAENALCNLRGVRDITNNIRIASSIMPENVQVQFYHELERRGFYDARNLTLNVEGGIIHIRGTVENVQQWNLISRVAAAVAGVTEVHNEVNIVKASQMEPAE